MICEGDVFIIKFGKLLLIYLQEERLMVLSFSEFVENYVIELVYLGYVLGNYYWLIIIKRNRIYI